MAAPSKYLRVDADGVSRLILDDAEVVMAGMNRMHFYRLTGATPEEATDEQVEQFFSLRSQEDETGERITEKLATESATDMVTRELKILNLPQVMDADNAVSGDTAGPSYPSGRESASGQPSDAVQARPPSVQPPTTSNRHVDSPLGAPPRHQVGGAGMPPAPRYQPTSSEGGSASSSAPEAASSAATPGPTNAGDRPASRYVRAEGDVLYLQSPDGGEQRVTQYMRTHFLRMIEKDIGQAEDADIELWFKSQGSLDAGTSMQEARSQSLLAEALKAAGNLKLQELEILQQVVDSWIAARRSEQGGQ